MIGPEHIWSFSFIDDVAAAHVAAAVHPNPAREYNVGGVNSPQLIIYEFLRERRGRPLPRRISYALASTAAVAAEVYAAVSGRPPLLTRGAVEIFQHDWPLDSRTAHNDLGLRLTAPADGFERTLAALQ
jgi:nucleoside-diphosphate-sugar epimerase